MKEIVDLSEIKDIELEIMKKVHRFCLENGITYYLGYGSLIGAIRHKGFIPWDDDIDILMPREDYNKFCEIFNLVEDEIGLVLVNSKAKHYVGRPMSKVIDPRTVLIESKYKGITPIGIFIDVFPLDGMPSNKFSKKCHLIHTKILTNLFYANIISEQTCKNMKFKIGYFIGRFLSGKKLLNSIEKTICKYSYQDAEKVTCYVDPYRVEMDKKWFSSALLVPFEDTEFWIPSGYDDILRSLYGDYMIPPPEDKRMPHHDINMNAYWK